jgi:hypothetical protein
MPSSVEYIGWGSGAWGQTPWGTDLTIVSVDGVVAVGQVGSVTVTGIANVPVTGVAAVGQVGTATVDAEANAL